MTASEWIIINKVCTWHHYWPMPHCWLTTKTASLHLCILMSPEIEINSIKIGLPTVSKTAVACSDWQFAFNEISSANVIECRTWREYVFFTFVARLTSIRLSIFYTNIVNKINNKNGILCFALIRLRGLIYTRFSAQFGQNMNNIKRASCLSCL